MTININLSKKRAAYLRTWLADRYGDGQLRTLLRKAGEEAVEKQRQLELFKEVQDHSVPRQTRVNPDKPYDLQERLNRLERAYRLGAIITAYNFQGDPDKGVRVWTLAALRGLARDPDIDFTINGIREPLRPRKPQHIIPPITDPLGKHWDQPDRDKIKVIGDFALMTRETLDQLSEYSTSQPSGVYPGKCWKRRRPGTPGPWTLCWYGTHPNPKLCSNNYRQIVTTSF